MIGKDHDLGARFVRGETTSGTVGARPGSEQNHRKSQQRKMSEQLTQLKSQCSQMQKDVAAKERELDEARTRGTQEGRLSNKRELCPGKG